MKWNHNLKAVVTKRKGIELNGEGNICIEEAREKNNKEGNGGTTERWGDRGMKGEM